MALTASVQDFTAVGVVAAVGSSFTFRPLLVDPAVVTRAPWSVRVGTEGTFTTLLPGGPVKITATANGWRSIDVAGYPDDVTLTELLTATNPDGSLKYVIDPTTLQPLNPLPPSAAEILAEAGQARDDAQAVAAALPAAAEDAVAAETAAQVAPLVAQAAGEADSAAASQVLAATSASNAQAAAVEAAEVVEALRFPLATTIDYDAEGNVTSVTEGGITTTYTYNPDGSVATDTRNSITREYTYDAAGNLVSMEA